ncbi:MAG: aminotransferase [Magnetovibrio sp.]|nr:aminotransferase [Magnetovibrio sp.]
MPGFELFGKEERDAINEIFDLNGGIVFAHGFDAMRNGVYRVREYERAFADVMGARHGQAVSSGTAAIKVALKGLGIGPGDEVITQAYTFVATVEAIFETGATPVIVDVDDTLNMDPAALEAAITPRTRAVVPVHMMGEVAAMDEIMAIARKHDLLVMEDAAQALGATYNGRHAGTIGHMGAFSTDAGKTLNTGEGGMVLTDDEKLYENARAYHDHGHEYSTTLGRGEEAALCRGFNYRMTEIHAAIGLAQLKKLDTVVSRQRENKAKLVAGLEPLGLRFRRSLDPAGDIGDTLVFYLADRERCASVVAAMREAGLGTKNLPDAIRWHFAKHWEHMLDDHPLYKGRVSDAWAPSADILERSIALPVMVKMDDTRIDEIVTKLSAIIRSNT